jgi:RHS repeat-associated protein
VYGFNGQERSTELGNDSYTAEFWQYDSRLGRRWNIDPAIKPNESPYAAFANNPIWFTDHNGADTTLPSADGGSLTLPTGVSDIRTFDANKNYTVAGKQVKPASGGVLGFSYNNVSYTAHYYTADQTFAYYLGADGSKLGYDVNTIPSNIEFTGGERLATAGTIVMFAPRTPGLNRVPPAYVIGGAFAIGGALSSLYHWNNVSNDFGMTRPLPFTLPPPALPISIPFPGHGNRLDNSNPHMVYEFSFIPTDGRTPILKYGIADMYKTGYDRPEKQLPAMMAMYGVSVKWKPLMFTPNRASALAAEGASVTSHVGIYGEMPRAQILPKPN